MAKTKLVQFTVEQYAEAKEKAKELGINPVGKSKQALVDLVNEQLKAAAEAASTPAPKAKWYETNPLDVESGDTVQIVTKTVEKAGETKDILKGRYAQVVGPSPKEGLIRAILLNEKTGELQNCVITIEVGKYTKVPEGWVFVPTSTEEDQEPAEAVQQSA